jgi:hypothetical protein
MACRVFGITTAEIAYINYSNILRIIPAQHTPMVPWNSVSRHLKHLSTSPGDTEEKELGIGFDGIVLRNTSR